MFCGLTKEFLSQHNISFIDRDITRDPAALAELRELGYMTTPVTKINGDFIIGFDEARLKTALGL